MKTTPPTEEQGIEMKALRIELSGWLFAGKDLSVLSDKDFVERVLPQMGDRNWILTTLELPRTVFQASFTNDNPFTPLPGTDVAESDYSPLAYARAMQSVMRIEANGIEKGTRRTEPIRFQPCGLMGGH